MKIIKLFLFAVICLAVASCGGSAKPNNKIYSTETKPGGYRPDTDPKKPPVAITDTTVILKPTGAQARRWASQRGDFIPMQILGWVLLLAAAGFFYGMVSDASWFPKLGPIWIGLILFALIALSAASCKGHQSSIKWNNSKSIPKPVYDKAMREHGSTAPIWDSLEKNCLIVFGGYKCYK